MTDNEQREALANLPFAGWRVGYPAADAVLAFLDESGWVAPEVHRAALDRLASGSAAVSTSLVSDRDERIAALQAQLDAIREQRCACGVHPAVDYHAEEVDALLASAPSDVLDRVKREAAAQALEDAADGWSGGPYRAFAQVLSARAAAIRSEATK